MNCAICLRSLRAPVSLPCGHIFDSTCIDVYITTRQESLEILEEEDEDEDILIPCPNCRIKFSPAIVEDKYVPKQYRKYLHSPLRTVYLDLSPAERFQEQRNLARAELSDVQKENITKDSRIAHLERENSLLMDKYDSLHSSFLQHWDGEAQVRRDKDRLTGQKQVLIHKLAEVRKENRHLTHKLVEANTLKEESQARFDLLASGVQRLNSTIDDSYEMKYLAIVPKKEPAIEPSIPEGYEGNASPPSRKRPFPTYDSPSSDSDSNDSDSNDSDPTHVWEEGGPPSKRSKFGSYAGSPLGDIFVDDDYF